MARTSNAKVTGIENRGSEDKPFGYVYFGDTRVGYHNVEAVEGCERHLDMWATRPEGYWPQPTTAQFRAAAQALSEVFPAWFPELSRQ